MQARYLLSRAPALFALGIFEHLYWYPLMSPIQLGLQVHPTSPTFFVEMESHFVPGLLQTAVLLTFISQVDGITGLSHLTCPLLLI
jgi:hypothetical protein